MKPPRLWLVNYLALVVWIVVVVTFVPTGNSIETYVGGAVIALVMGLVVFVFLDRALR